MVETRLKAFHRDARINDATLIVFDVTAQTADESLRELGAISTLLMDIVQEVCGFTGPISVEKHVNGVRISVTVEKSEDST